MQFLIGVRFLVENLFTGGKKQSIMSYAQNLKLKSITVNANQYDTYI